MDSRTALDEITKHFGVPCWLGHYTRRYWALVRTGDRWRLVEALSVGELTVALTYPEGWPWP
mgnify:CR=1 FL=1